jgi:3-isopropylmalate dehydrogenase
VEQAVLVLERVATERIGFSFDELSIGAGEYLRSGDPLPESTFLRIQNYDAVLLGAMGLPGVRWPNGVEMTPQLDLRERLDLFAGLRPIYLFHAADAPLKQRSAGSIDLLIFRENTEGLFFSRKNRQDNAAPFAEDTLRISKSGSERLFHAAFQEARRRRNHVTLVDKANVLPSMAYFRAIFDRIADEYPDVATDRVYVDAASLYLVRNPERFDVMVTENMFGDILSDLAAGLVGGMGMAPSADIGETHGVFQPSHGSAPDIAGKGIANPVATILSAAMMLDWLSRADAGAAAMADRIREAVRRVFMDPQARTPDMGGALSTSEMGNLIIQALN